MPSITPIINTAKQSSNPIIKLIKDPLNIKVVDKIFDYAEKNPAGFASKVVLISALTKDAVGCYYYVKQSLHNEKIPEDKRNFVAAVDLMNGILNITLQFTIGLWVDKNLPKWFENTIGKKLEKINTEKISDNVHNFIKETAKKENKPFWDKLLAKATPEKLDNFLREKVLGPKGKATTLLKVGYSSIAVLIATQVITKRMINPYLSTPLATWYKNKFMDKKKKPTEGSDLPTPEPLVNKLSAQPLAINLQGSTNLNKDIFKQFMDKQH